MGERYFDNLVSPVLKELDARRIAARETVGGVKIRTCGYHQWDTVLEDDAGWREFPPGETWGGLDAHYCFSARVAVPSAFAGKHVVCRVTTGATDIWNYNNPQFLAYIDGRIVCGLDVNHTEFDVPPEILARGSFRLAFFAYANTGKKDLFFDVSLCVKDDLVEKFYYDLKIPFDIAQTLHDDDGDWLALSAVVSKAVSFLDLRETGSAAFLESVTAAGECLQSELYRANAGHDPVIEHCVGHTHIDVAWLWTLAQTREKVLRSFSNALCLMDRYPEFKFMSSQPVLYDFVRENNPVMYEAIKKRVAENRWEIEGAMWLEADCNLTSGESLVRQILYGKKFIREEFGRDSRILWLPDVFGYSAALPQIMKQSGIDYFMTTKIAWNDTNRIPHDTMRWQGIDGSRVLMHFITTATFNKYELLDPHPSHSTTYNGTLTPKQVKGCWQRYQDKELNTRVLQCYGNGDGGGGPTAEMLENARRLEVSLPGCPRVVHSSATEYFSLLDRDLAGKKNVPVWNGELYLEFHRGTYTSMARNKKFNRKAEFSLGAAEFFSVLAAPDFRGYPTAELESCWKLALLNQFHDILPGSAIKDVYEDSSSQYRDLLERTGRIIAESIDTVCGTQGADASGSANRIPDSVTVFNQLGHERTSLAAFRSDGALFDVYDGETLLPSRLRDDGYVEFLAPLVPSVGYRRFGLKPSTANAASTANDARNPAVGGPVPAAPRRLSTAFYDVAFDGQGCLVSLFDREEGREVIAPGGQGNLLEAFDDRPAEYDAWNLDPQYAQRSWEIGGLDSFVLEYEGSLGVRLVQTRTFLSSSIRQEIVFHSHTRRIDFRTVIDWKESHLLVKAAFPVDVMANRAAYEIQFGHVERDTHRNTSWDEARFEVCAHKWADVSEDGYGVSLMNDCKYGYDIHDSVMRLSLLRSPSYPNPDADRELHEFTYALFPHRGNYREAGVVRESFDLNCPPYTRVHFASSARGAGSFSLVSVDAENVVITAVKKAEADDSLIVRAYESRGRRTRASMRFFVPENGAILVEDCDLLENPRCELSSRDGTVPILILPFEIRTFRVTSRKICNANEGFAARNT